MVLHEQIIKLVAYAVDRKESRVLTLSCKLVHFISHAWIVEVVIQ